MRRLVSLALVLVGTLAALYATAFEVRQVFRPERFVRGNVNLRKVQPIDEAAWLWLKGVEFGAGRYPVLRFRREFEASGAPMAFDVSADPRYVLFLDGQEISRGPHKGFVRHWHYQSYEVTGLSPGRHLLEAVVFHQGEKGPMAVLTSGRGGFVLKAEGVYDALLTTGKAPWQVAEVATTSYGGRTDPDSMTACENIVRGTGFLDGRGLEWQIANVVLLPLRESEYGWRRIAWDLFPTERCDEMTLPRLTGRVKASQAVFGRTNLVYSAADAQDAWVGRFDALIRRGEPLTVPAHAERRFIWDFDDYICAFPELGTSGGKGAEVRWAWAESLYGTNITGHVYLNKGNRGEFLGKRVVFSTYDTFLPDGRDDAQFTVPWWRSGRWVEFSVKTADEPLVLNRLSIVETRYPMEPKASFSCDDPTIADVRRICLRGMQNCLHEMFMDCPYYEQQMYPGDTRVEMLTLNTVFGDDRLLRFGIGIFDAARRNDGLVPMNFPTTVCQDSSTYAMCWAMMVGDYVLWHGVNDFLRARIPGLRHTLSAIDLSRNAEGLLEDLPGWSFVDWVPEWDKFGNAPEGRRGVSSINNLLFVLALKSAAKAERATGDAVLAEMWARKADEYAAATVRKFWCEERGLVADTASKTVFSEHAQCLALLAGVLPPDREKRAFEGLVEAPDLARTTVYFSHYLFATYLKFGRADLFLRRLDLWRDFVKQGLKTPLEAPGWRGRSDCHAWGSHPLYHLQTGIAGIMPSADGFSAVRIAPQPGGLRVVKASMPTPKGEVRVDFRFDEGKVSGTVILPRDLPGAFVWNGVTQTLHTGRNRVFQGKFGIIPQQRGLRLANGSDSE